MSRPEDEMRELVRAARQAHIEVDLLLDCVQRRLIPLERGWTQESIEFACRVRRLMSLGVNIQGVEVAFHMRQQIIEMQEEMAHLREQMQQMREAHEQELARLLRRLATEAQEP
jgi:DNA-binding transcriptional MerR regulator